LGGNSIKMRDTAKSEISQYYNKTNPGYSIPIISYNDGTVSISGILIETDNGKPCVRFNNICKIDHADSIINIRYSVYGANGEFLGEGYVVKKVFGSSTPSCSTKTMPVDYLPTRVEINSVTAYPTSYNIDTGEQYASSVEKKSDTNLYIIKTSFQSYIGRFKIVLIVYAILLLIGLGGQKSK
jgi:hypothetical protein